MGLTPLRLARLKSSKSGGLSPFTPSHRKDQPKSIVERLEISCTEHTHFLGEI